MKKQEKLEARKVRKAGNSLIVSLPENVIEALDVQKGESIQFVIKEDSTVTLEKKNDEFLSLIEKIYDENQDIIEALAEQ